MDIPKQVKSVIEKLEKNGFETHIVGGCVRDFLRNVKPKDWDIATIAKPEQIQKLFPDSFYKNKFRFKILKYLFYIHIRFVKNKFLFPVK